jgi:trigger factor
MTSQNRPPISEKILREVRRRCGFGCVICGLPLYEYEHMLGWAKVKRHKADEITLLCSFHHAEKTKGLLPLESVKAANTNPHNLRDEESKPYALHYAGEAVECAIGDCVFLTKKGQTYLAPLAVCGEPLIAFDLVDGQLLLTLNLYADDGSTLLRIDKNELVYSVHPWDITFVGKVLMLREAERKIVIEIEFLVPSKVHIRRGIFHKNGIEVVVGCDFLYITNNESMLCGARMQGIQIGIAIGDPRPQGTICFLFGGSLPPLPARDVARSRLRRRLKESRELRKNQAWELLPKH